MRLAFMLCVLSLGLVATLAEPNLERLERAELFGREYVRLRDWAKANQFKVTGGSDRRDTWLTDRTHRLVFRSDSRKATLDGLSVWLSFPVAAWRGTTWITTADLRTLVHPVLFPAIDGRGRKVGTILLDPGHGGKDPGNEVGKRQEKYYTLLLARELRGLLVKSGFRVALTRTTDSYVDLPVRPALARKYQADLFVSLHFNSVPGERNDVRGIEIYCLPPAGAGSTTSGNHEGSDRSWPGNRRNNESVLLAYQVQKALVGQLQMEDRGLRRARFEVLRLSEVPAILIEAGFLSDPQDAARVADPQERLRIARAIRDGLLGYKRLVER